MIGIVGIMVGFGNSIWATEQPLPAVSRATANGVWEAVPESSDRVYHFEVVPTGESYLAFKLAPSGFDFLYKLVSLTIDGKQIALRFEGVPETHAEGTSIAIDGDCVADNSLGYLHGTLRITSQSGGSSMEKLNFMKGSWTRKLGDLSSGAEALIERERLRNK